MCGFGHCCVFVVVRRVRRLEVCIFGYVGEEAGRVLLTKEGMEETRELYLHASCGAVEGSFTVRCHFDLAARLAACVTWSGYRAETSAGFAVVERMCSCN